ncbi:MAG: bifunctional precorrin-2 dehydrogenase/sirohydrochlorin ferrochelatase [Candidatus Azobacteroides pseudotrichonymphae]|jgi:siroheme synthase-like protein|uniref:precorrin-2 dehydrogenase n=1 Tax=Azobacteroides pseudotrichonymphae genomovar. CFP2 TaxID=511995 RepID=B6YQS4_AZOPC|nr:bifunctional precorrin-2 dehydrogenase/sirohydrochlorin ferrochelatase [Candidatus Azobacteroides pseudotrichonymphae]BAG83546.1 siroheme synthase N-terminal domain protein [Candidatus Azobacteroides pseudotrichonymphae genomovar. CFP2]GMO32682.1 MAG: bifunctional precorrin-2 dehydrogenase/sirohydrochlorin ferrochelatase [Candidatus Azobacteroides pseudotrichonymphae]
MSIFLPISINITGKHILIVGGGKIAFHKATILSLFTNRIIVVSPKFCSEFELSSFKKKRKEYESKDLENVFLVYICTEKESLNMIIKVDCENHNILTNVCDNPSLCDFISPAIYKNDNVTIAISSNAENVWQSIIIRDQIKFLIERNILKIN